MKIEYAEALNETLDHAKKISAIYKSWERSKTGFKHPEKGAAYKNYLLIVCYGKIEYVFKNMVADYFTGPNMPQRCVQFGNTLRDRMTGSLAKDRLNHFIKNECSEDWFNEIKRRDSDITYKCKKYKSYTFAEAYIALTSLTNNRHNFAHGDKAYTGSIDNLIQYYKKAVAWLYEIDDIINTAG